MKTRNSPLTATVLAVLLLTLPCRAQWLTQQITLRPGWNAVYLEVQPEPRDCDTVFNDSPIQSVWKWDRRFSTIQFTVDPATLLPEAPDWLVWLPPSDPRAFLNRLFELQGCQAYLVKVAPNAASFTLSIKGRVLLPRLEWYPHGLNLVGLPVHSDHPPTFTDFFRFTPEVDTSRGYANELYRLDAGGRGQRIVQPARDRPQPGVAYWVKCARAPAHQSALHVTPSGGAVDFGSLLAAQDLTIQNTHPSDTLTVRLTLCASESAPMTGGFPELAGPVPLSYLTRDASNRWVWLEFPATGITQTLSPGAPWPLRLGVRRLDFAPYVPQGTNGATYQSILEVTDSGQSLRIRVPVMARKSVESQGGLAATEAHVENEGLWVGEARINQINAPAYTTSLLGTPAPMPFRLLLHVDGDGRANLLSHVVLAWDSTLTDAPHTNGAYALYASDRTLPAGATDVNRIGSASFPLMMPTLLSGSFSNALTGRVTVRFDDPTNPFLHRYHPLHDNQDWNFQTYTQAVETPTILRDLTLQFTPTTNAPANPFWGVDIVGGTYLETLGGLRAQPIQVQGTFTLQRISRINTLRSATP